MKRRMMGRMKGRMDGIIVVYVGECVWLPSEGMRCSHRGGLVSPTDRPTISAMTAIRIDTANARIRIFCQAKKMYLGIFHWEIKTYNNSRRTTISV